MGQTNIIQLSLLLSQSRGGIDRIGYRKATKYVRILHSSPAVEATNQVVVIGPTPTQCQFDPLPNIQNQPQIQIVSPSSAQLSTTTPQNALATRAFTQGRLLSLNPRPSYRRCPSFLFPSPADDPRTCHRPRPSAAAEAHQVWGTEGSGSHFSELVWTPWGRFGEREEVWGLA